MAVLKTASHTISVTVDDRAIRVHPDTLIMTSQDEVQWTGTTPRGFTIEFDGPTPFVERSLSHTLAATRRKPKSTGRYKYTVVSTADPDVRLDPVIIVEDPPTPNP